ncbi:hypothetical protein F53441_11758 [Fusarium austroafricanum]|uniref:Uncharacterized protein n=1 Tax=Fusarium austroafricanum TaxID=2364996 RepID=A0A8H4NYR1_9HYPO|nr:hypothetical protein F53441_11758 [Fusarium austroafricanum]
MSTLIQEGAILTPDFVIAKEVGSTEHATIFSVHYIGSYDDNPDITYEARCYDFGNIAPNVKSNRARAIRRLSQRTVFSTTVDDLRIIVYRTGNLQCKDMKDQKESNGILPKENPIAEKAPKTSKSKTTRQRESARLRQISRRSRKRGEKEEFKATFQDEDNQYVDLEQSLEQILASYGCKLVKNDLIERAEVDEDEFRFFQMLYLIINYQKGRQEAPSWASLQAMLQAIKYTEAKDEEVVIDGEDALVELIAIKEREIVFLKRTHSMFQPVLKNWHSYLNQVLRYQEKYLLIFGMRYKIPKELSETLRDLTGFTKELEKLQTLQLGEQILKLRWDYMILKEALEGLPHLIEEVERTVQTLRLKLRDARDAREKRDAKQTAKLEKKNLGKKIKNLKKWILLVMPGSPGYYAIEEDIISAEQELERLRLSDDG